MLAKSKRTPIKHSSSLRAVCAAHNVTIEDANLMVCQGRKVVYVLRVGSIHSKACFLREPPTPSYRKESGIPESGWKLVVIPNGWKVAVIVDSEVWTAEVSYDHNDRDLAQYQFVRMGELGENVSQSDWCYTPSGAFKAAYTPTGDAGEDQAWGRHNGKLYLGCTYDHPQMYIRTYFGQRLRDGKESWEPSLRQSVQEWLDPVKSVLISPVKSSNSGMPQKSLPTPALIRSESDVLRRVQWESSSTDDAESDPGASKRKRARNSAVAAAHGKLSSDAFASSASLQPQFTTFKYPLPNLLGHNCSNKLDTATSIWTNQVWNDISAASEGSTPSRLRGLFSALSVNPDPASQAKAFSSQSESWLNEGELLAIVSYVEGQVQRLAAEKETRGGQTGPLPSLSARALPTLGNSSFGSIPTGAVSRIMEQTPTSKLIGGALHVKMEDFVDSLEALESCAEYMHQVLTQTLFLFPLQDIVQRVCEGKSVQFRKGIASIQQRLTDLNVVTFDRFHVFVNAQDFVRTVTGLPKAVVVRKFVTALYSVAPPHPSTTNKSSANFSSFINQPSSSLSDSSSSSSAWKNLSSAFPPPSSSTTTTSAASALSVLGSLPQFAFPSNWTRTPSFPLAPPTTGTAGGGAAGGGANNISSLPPPWYRTPDDFKALLAAAAAGVVPSSSSTSSTSSSLENLAALASNSNSGGDVMSNSSRANTAAAVLAHPAAGS